MVQLQRPDFVYARGKVRPWEEAVLHVSTEAVNRGLNVFEGIKGYWDERESEFALVAVRKHWERLHRSARLLHIPFSMSLVDFRRACESLLEALLIREQDMWVRATLFVVEGHWGEGTVADLVLTAYHQPKRRPAPIDVGVSTWRRASDVVLPPRIKTSTNYQVARLARIEGRGRGYSDMVLLNQWDRVAEATGSCILLVRDGKVATPPPSEGVLESITVNIVESLAQSLAIPFTRRPIDRTELYVADALALAGTLAELAPIGSIDDHRLPEESPIVDALSDRFWDAVRGTEPHAAVERSIVGSSGISSDVD